MHQISFFENSSYIKDSQSKSKSNSNSNSKFSELDVTFKEFTIYKVRNFLNRNKLFDSVFNLYIRLNTKKIDSLYFENHLFKLINNLDKKFSKNKKRLVGFDYPSYNANYKLGLAFVKESYEELKNRTIELAETSAKLAMFS